MKLLALHLTNVRKFTGKRASITGIGKGITVVSEANEFGKSTFFDAIHALFFEKYSSSAKPVKSLQPYAGGAVEVAAEVETDQGTFRVEKRFLSKKAAKISRLSDGVTIAQDDEAERWISTLLGTAHDGPAGLLWVRQGLFGLEADSAKEKSQLMETRRDILSSVAGEIDTMTGGRRMDRVMRSVGKSLAEIATKTGRKSGAWKAASDAAEALDTELESVTAQVQTLDKAQRDRKQAEVTLTRLENPDAKARRDGAFLAAKTAMESATAHVGAVKAAQQEHDLASLKSQNAKADLDAFLKAIDTLKTAQMHAKDSLAKANEAKIVARHLKDILDAAQIHHTTATQSVAAARKRLDNTRSQLSARKAKTEVSQLAVQIAKAKASLEKRDSARAVTKASLATSDWLRRAEEAQGEVTKRAAFVDAQTMTLSIAYEGKARITQNGAPLLADQPIVLDGDTELDLPGIGTMTIHAKSVGDDGRKRLTAAQDYFNSILSEVGAKTMQDARAFATTRAEAAAKVDLEQAILDTLAPNGIETLQAAKAEADLAAVDADSAILPTISDLESLVVQSEEAEGAARQQVSVADTDYAIAREGSANRQAIAEAAQGALERAETSAGPVETRDGRRADRLRLQAQEHAALMKAEADLQAVVAAAPDLDTTAAELKRAEDAVAAARQERAQLGERLAALSSEIRTLAGNGIEERRDEVAGELDAVRASEARFTQQAAALTRLQAALDAERDAARDTYFEPVQEELKPLLSILYRDAALSFDIKSLLPTGLLRDAEEETLDDLSGGTKEQIAILTRLAFARLFARKGRHMPIILDDALVYSDDDRIIKMFTALTRVAQDQQIIVFSCRQLAFQDLGGARPKIEILEA